MDQFAPHVLLEHTLAHPGRQQCRAQQNTMPRCLYCDGDMTVAMILHRKGYEDWPKWTAKCCFCGATGPTAETIELAIEWYQTGYPRPVSWENRDGPVQCRHGNLETELCVQCVAEFREDKN